MEPFFNRLPLENSQNTLPTHAARSRMVLGHEVVVRIEYADYTAMAR